MITKKRENPMSVRSKNALAGALIRLMLRRDYNEITISDITGAARLSRQTFYTNFEKKEDILNYLIDGLFAKYREEIRAKPPSPEDILVDYFIFWNENRDFLSLLMRHRLGFLFGDRNRAFFLGESGLLDGMITAEPWQMPYVRVSLAGITYELTRLWITEEEGLPVSTLSSMTSKLLCGGIFREE